MKITAWHVRIPMRYRFGHARASRNVADNIVVECELPDGIRGWGECVPREYVTGETIESVLREVRAARVPDFRDLRDVANDLAGRALCEGNAASCALELAVLDAFARREQRHLLDAVEGGAFAAYLRPSPTHVRQTLTLGDDIDGALGRAGVLSGELDIKLKVGLQDDPSRIERVRQLFPNVDLRGDANGALTLESASTIGHQLSSLEEPLTRDLGGCARLRHDGVRVMLDESVSTLADAQRAIDANAADLFNLRLSKNGGLFGTLRIVELARRHNIAWQLGCMVGETGILSSLGRAFVGRIDGARYFESTVPTKSLEEDITDAQLDHMSGTRMTPVPSGMGFGANLRRDVLLRYVV